VSWNTAHNYIGSVKTFLEKFLKKVTKKLMEKAKENGAKLVNSSDSLKRIS
jgi:histone H3/H4